MYEGEMVLLQAAITYTFRFCILTQTHLLVRLVLRIATLVPIQLAIALKCENVCTDTIEEPTVVGNNYGTTCEVLQTFLQCTECVDVDIVGRLVE